MDCNKALNDESDRRHKICGECFLEPILTVAEAIGQIIEIVNRQN